jgi:hypothetical protein
LNVENLVFFTYQGVDGSGSPFNGNGFAPENHWLTNGWATSVVQAPAGGYLTQIKLTTGDDTWWTSDGTIYPAGEFSLKAMEVTFLHKVPEPSTFADEAFMLLVLAAVPFISRKGSASRRTLSS